MRVVTLNHDGVIALTPEDMEALNLRLGDDFVIDRQGDEIVLTPLNLVNAQE